MAGRETVWVKRVPREQPGMNAVIGDLVLQSAGELLPAGVINGAGIAVSLAGIAIVLVWWAYLFR
jgi:hypothetical protein